ncbi:MAG TPA: phage holin family protein [Microcoleaceae cyanobacterium]|jgi:putative membrane protein
MALLVLFFVVAIVTAVNLVIISKLPLGIEVDSCEKAIVAGIIFGILNALIKPILVLLTLPLTIFTLGAFLAFVNAIIFGLTAWLVHGFRLRWGFISALLGGILLSAMNTFCLSLLSRFLSRLS